MTKNKQPLTEEQCRLVSNNHNLIYSFAYRRNVLLDDYYDILAIGLCKAAKIYDKNKGKFSTLAFNIMENELITYQNSLRKQSAIPSELVFSYDVPKYYNDCYEDNFLEKFTDDCVDNEVINDIMLSTFVETLTDKEKNIVNFLINGLTHKEIANIMDCPRQNITYFVKHIRNKANKYLSYN